MGHPWVLPQTLPPPQKRGSKAKTNKQNKTVAPATLNYNPRTWEAQRYKTPIQQKQALQSACGPIITLNTDVYSLNQEQNQ